MMDAPVSRDELVRSMLADRRSPAERNAPYVRPGASNFNTQLPLMDELQFRQWLGANKVPFNPDAPVTDYDMRGFYQAAQQQRPGVSTAISPYDQQVHYPDTYKTPMHPTFSQGSQWAGPMAPRWHNDVLSTPGGRIIADETPPDSGATP